MKKSDRILENYRAFRRHYAQQYESAAAEEIRTRLLTCVIYADVCYGLLLDRSQATGSIMTYSSNQKTKFQERLKETAKQLETYDSHVAQISDPAILKQQQSIREKLIDLQTRYFQSEIYHQKWIATAFQLGELLLESTLGEEIFEAPAQEEALQAVRTLGDFLSGLFDPSSFLGGIQTVEEIMSGLDFDKPAVEFIDRLDQQIAILSTWAVLAQAYLAFFINIGKQSDIKMRDLTAAIETRFEAAANEIRQGSAPA